ncbi:hypothetical protein [Lysinibacillus xylanilyticus]
MFSARKRSGSDKSAQSERKSTTRYSDELILFSLTLFRGIFYLMGTY